MNPLNLSLGDKICATHHVTVEYIGNSKLIVKNGLPDAVLTVTGIKRKATGRYKEGYRSTLDMSEYESGSLVDRKYHTLYEAKQSIESDTLLIQPEDIIMERGKCIMCTGDQQPDESGHHRCDGHISECPNALEPCGLCHGCLPPGEVCRGCNRMNPYDYTC